MPVYYGVLTPNTYLDRGRYDFSTSYSVNDLVLQNDTPYICNTNHTPPLYQFDSSKWTELTSPGIFGNINLGNLSAINNISLVGYSGATYRGVLGVANTTISFTGLIAGSNWKMELRQDVTGGRSINWTGVTWIPSGPPPLAISTNAVNLFEFFSPDGSTIYGQPLTPSVSNPGLGLYATPARLENIPRTIASNVASLSSGFTELNHITPDRDFVVSNILTLQRGTVAATITLAKLAIYQVSGVNNFSCIARSANNTSRWTVNGLDTASIVDDGAASPSLISSVTLRSGTEYAIALLIVASTAPQLAGMSTHATFNVLTPRTFSSSAGSQTDLPVSYSGLGAGAGGHWIGLT